MMVNQLCDFVDHKIMNGNLWWAKVVTNAQLGDMYYCYPAFDSYGNMYIAQNNDNTIRKIDVSGTITTIAGTQRKTGWLQIHDKISKRSNSFINPIPGIST
jgi:hypothetical protein